MAISEKVMKGLSSDAFMDKMAEDGQALKQKYGEDRVFDLTLDNPMTEPPATFEAELKKLMASGRPGLHRYMENAGYVDTRSAVAERLAAETGLPFTLNHVIMTSGATGALNMALKAVLNPGEEVILFAPFFFDYEAYVENHAAVLKIVKAGPDFMPDLADLERLISPRTKIMIINSPQNPTGVVYSENCLKSIAEIVTRRSALFNTRIYIASDDTYRQFYYGSGKCPWILDYYPHTIIVGSYSKEMAIPGERIGYTAVSPHCEDARTVYGGLIHANRTLGFVNAPGLMQNAVRGLQHQTVNISEFKARRDLLYRNLRDLGYQVNCPEGAFFLFPRTPLADDKAFAIELKNLRVLTVPGSLFRAPGYLRVSYCVEEKVLMGSLDGFRQALQKYLK